MDLRGRKPLEQENTQVELFGGQALNAEAADHLLRSRKATIVAPIGPVGVGKTTLLAGLYELFCKGPVGSYHFAGSKTIMGFETRCHEASRRAGLITPDTPRTNRDTRQVYLHLSAVSEEFGNCDLLLIDISGELLDDMVRFGDETLLNYVAAAHVIVSLVDGAQLGNPATRQTAIANARTAARAVLERCPQAAQARWVFVVTKWDLCRDQEGLDVEIAKIPPLGLEAQGSLEILKLAVRADEPSELPERYHAAELFQLLATTPTHGRSKVAALSAPSPKNPYSSFEPGSALLARLHGAL